MRIFYETDQLDEQFQKQAINKLNEHFDFSNELRHKFDFPKVEQELFFYFFPLLTLSNFTFDSTL